MIFKKCENCKKMKFRWMVKKQKIFVPKLMQDIRGKIEICGTCRKKVEQVIKQMNA